MNGNGLNQCRKNAVENMALKIVSESPQTDRFVHRTTGTDSKNRNDAELDERIKRYGEDCKYQL